MPTSQNALGSGMAATVVATCRNSQVDPPRSTVSRCDDTGSLIIVGPNVALKSTMGPFDEMIRVKCTKLLALSTVESNVRPDVYDAPGKVRVHDPVRVPTATALVGIPATLAELPVTLARVPVTPDSDTAYGFTSSERFLPKEIYSNHVCAGTSNDTGSKVNYPVVVSSTDTMGFVS